MPTLKELAATGQIVMQEALRSALTELKTYLDSQSSSSSAAIAAVNARIDTLIGSGDTSSVIDTFNEIKAFLADYDNQDTLKSLIDAAINAATTAETNAKNYADTKVQAEQARATGAENALSGRITKLEDVSVMTASEAKAIFDSVFYPTQP